jgi:hypothetical protein
LSTKLLDEGVIPRGRHNGELTRTSRFVLLTIYDEKTPTAIVAATNIKARIKCAKDQTNARWVFVLHAHHNFTSL